MLGVFIDSKLNFSKNISKLCSKLSYCTHLLRKFTNILSRRQLISIYYAYAHSIISYGITIWGLSAKKYINKLNKIHNILIRCIWGVNGNTNRIKTKDMYKNLNILTINNLLLYSLANNIHKLENDIGSSLIRSSINRNNLSIHPHHTS